MKKKHFSQLSGSLACGIAQGGSTHLLRPVNNLTLAQIGLAISRDWSVYIPTILHVGYIRLISPVFIY